MKFRIGSNVILIPWLLPPLLVLGFLTIGWQATLIVWLVPWIVTEILSAVL